MAKQVEKHEFTDSQGRRITIALLDNDAIRVRFNHKEPTAVTWHATGNGTNSTTIITPRR